MVSIAAYIADHPRTRLYVLTVAKYHRASTRLARWYHARHCSNPIDALTLEPTRNHHPLFLHVTPHHKIIGFSATHLADYILRTGNVLNPNTQVPFTSLEIRRLSRCSGIPLGEDVLARAREAHKKQQDRHNLYAYLEADSADVMLQMIDALQSCNTMQAIERSLSICRSLLPNLHQSWDRLRLADEHELELSRAHHVEMVTRAKLRGKYSERARKACLELLEGSIRKR